MRSRDALARAALGPLTATQSCVRDEILRSCEGRDFPISLEESFVMSHMRLWGFVHVEANEVSRWTKFAHDPPDWWTYPLE